IADPGIAVQIIEGPADVIAPGSELVRPPNAPPQVLDRPNDLGTERVVDARSGRGIVVSARDDDMRRGDQRQIVRYVSAAVFNGPQDRPATAVRRDDARQRGHRDLERRHRTAWRARWARCGTSIGGEPDLDRGVRFATFQLLAHGGSPSTDGTDDRELAIGARGVTGRSYKGHVFWDTDVFVVPALSSIAPHAAGAALRYRWNRLGPAMEAARAEGRWGARFPWESAHSGIDVTPRWGTDLHGRSIPIHTGELEIHIVGDIAWALDNHRRWTGDDRFMHRYGRTMLVESARYWASRIEVDDDGSAHIRDVIGPDEYHEHVDDNVFTNVVAGYNLRLAGRSTGVGEVDDAERTSWFALADALADGWDPVRGVHEQFTGFFELDPVMVDTIGRPPLSADALLGRERIQQTQVVKQPDVLMAHHLMPGEMRAGTLHADLDTYLPRTAAGSSLAPAICASLLFEAGRADEAVEWFDLAARLDLDDLTGTTAGGLHLATIGGLWQAVTIGVLGLRPAGTALRFEPHVPEQFGIVRHRFGFRGAIVTATVDGDDATVEATRELDISCGGESRSSSRHRMRRTGGAWTHR
ncbi:MAG: glycosyl hydrolase family 65 protein, partial [Actinomycetota bacterium]